MKNYVITFLNLFFFIFIFGCVSSNSEIKSLSSATKTLTCEFISYGSEECKIRRKSDSEICEDVKSIKKGVCVFFSFFLFLLLPLEVHLLISLATASLALVLAL